MTVPNITITQKHFDVAFEKHGLACDLIEIMNSCVKIALAEQSQEQYITAEEARKLGAGNAMYLLIDTWIPCDGYHYDTHYFGGEKVKYRATKQDPVENDADFLKRFKENVLTDVRRDLQTETADPHAELKAMYEKQAKDGTLKDFIWSYKNKPEDTETECITNPVFSPKTTYLCTPISEHYAYKHLYCKIRNLDTGELKTITRENAKLLQAETMDVCDWFVPASRGRLQSMFEFTDDGIYTYKLKDKPWTGTREDVIALLAEFKII